MTKISHLGAQNCVTGSCRLVQTRPGVVDSLNILIDCGSVHANRKMLVDWVCYMPHPPKEIQLVHGEPEARWALALGIV